MREPQFLFQRMPGALFRRVGAWFNTFLHRLILDEMGRGTRILSGGSLFFPGTARVGHDCLIGFGVETGSDIAGAELVIGDGVQINRNVHLDVTGGLRIGSGSLISEGAFVYTHSHGLDPRSAPEPLSKVIGEEVWIGMGAIILSSCRTIGSGAVIGAAAVVTKDVPDNAIVAGSPARVIGHRKGRLS